MRLSASLTFLAWVFTWANSTAFVSLSAVVTAPVSKLKSRSSQTSNDEDIFASQSDVASNHSSDRRRALSLIVTGASCLTSGVAWAAEDEVVDFAEIAARANKMSKDLDEKNPRTASTSRATDKSAYDFSLPVAGLPVPMSELVKQEFSEDGVPRVKAILFVNIKQDDPIARKNIPELIALATRYSRNAEGAFAVVISPSDQGYYEPDTSQLIRLKLASEYGYGINPATIITDKLNYLGTGAHPFWRWLQSNCRTPAGLGRIQGNFEKFLVDGRTGLPLRRYPRKYLPLNIADDIESVIAGKPLPPARANYMEEWRSAATESEQDTYRFEKGLNYFDQ